MERQNEIQRSNLYVAKVSLLAFSFFAAVFGIFFCIAKHNHYGTISFLLLKLVSLLLLRLNVKLMRGWLFRQFTPANLKCMLGVACFMLLVSLVFSIFLLVEGIKYETEFNFIHNNAYFAFIPCLVSNFWNVLLVYEVWNFIKMSEQHGTSSNKGFQNTSVTVVSYPI